MSFGTDYHNGYDCKCNTTTSFLQCVHGTVVVQPSARKEYHDTSKKNITRIPSGYVQEPKLVSIDGLFLPLCTVNYYATQSVSRNVGGES